MDMENLVEFDTFRHKNLVGFDTFGQKNLVGFDKSAIFAPKTEQKMENFRRKAYANLLDWKTNNNGSTAALVLGARRIGKSTLVEHFARQEYASYLLIDFSVAPAEVYDLFRDISNLDYIFTRLQLIYHVSLQPHKSAIIFDEVQMAPLARQAIKHLVKDRRYDYIETGSLITLQQRSVDIVIPSEETKIHMYPMDYEEFRWALGDTATVPLLREALHAGQPMGNAVHRRLMRDFRLYMLVGGMPQAVAEYLKSNDLGRVDRVKRDIISLYDEDLRKIDPSGKASDLFKDIPAQLSNNQSRYRVSSALHGQRADRTVDVVRALENTMTVNIAYHVNDPNAGLALTRDAERFKMYVADTGIFVTLGFKDKAFVENDIYSRLLADKLSANLGYLFENIVAQTLRASGKELYYHTMPTHDKKKNYEIDFLVADRHKVTPIEVKSSGYRTHTSLDAFCAKYKRRSQKQYVIYTKDLQVEPDITYLPCYMAMLL